MKNRSSDQERMWRLAGRYMGVGIELAVDVALPTVLGMWLDRRLGTTFILWIGLVVGLGAVVRTIVRIIKETDLSKL